MGSLGLPASDEHTGPRPFAWIDGAKVPSALADVAPGDRVWVRSTIERGTGTPAHGVDVLALRKAAAQL
jgi:hypothetical protein